MGAKAWQHVVVRAPLRWAPELVPAEVRAGDVALEVRHETTMEGAFWGRDAKRFRAVWRAGRSSGKGYVEFRPHSSKLHEAVVHLEAPSGLLGRLAWSAERLKRTALGLALSLRFEMDTRADERRAEGDRRVVRARARALA